MTTTTEFLEARMYGKRKMAKGGKLKMVEKDGKRVPFYAADGRGKMMGGGRMMYGKGGYATVSDMEKACNKMAGYNESLTPKG